MSGQIVNLNKARKARAKADRKREAQENAVRFGRTRAERARDSQAAERARKDLDGKQRET